MKKNEKKLNVEPKIEIIELVCQNTPDHTHGTKKIR